MTREVAEEYVKDMTYRDAVHNALQGKCIPYRKATLIKLYELLDKLEQEPYEDVIDRAEAMTEIMMFAGNVKSDEEDIYIKVSDAVQLLRELPPVNPQPKTGHWTISPNDCFATCSECGLSGDKGIFKHYRWCPICGTKMSEIPTGSEGRDKE